MQPPSAEILVLINDLIFETRIRAAASDAGLTALTCKDAGTFARLLAENHPAIVIIDLNTGGPSATAAVKAAAAHPSHPRVVCFVSHVDRELAAAAQVSGAEVMPRSAFVQRLPEVLATAHRAGKTDRPAG